MAPQSNRPTLGETFSHEAFHYLHNHNSTNMPPAQLILFAACRRRPGMSGIAKLRLFEKCTRRYLHNCDELDEICCDTGAL